MYLPATKYMWFIFSSVPLFLSAFAESTLAAIFSLLLNKPQGRLISTLTLQIFILWFLLITKKVNAKNQSTKGRSNLQKEGEGGGGGSEPNNKNFTWEGYE